MNIACARVTSDMGTEVLNLGKDLTDFLSVLDLRPLTNTTFDLLSFSSQFSSFIFVFFILIVDVF